jgi:hypothetical protein
MKFDRQLVGFFIEGVNRERGTSYGSPVFPEDQNLGPKVKAVEAIYTNAEGQGLAIEHTLIQPFMKEREDAFGAFEKIFVPLETDASMSLADYHIAIAIPALSVPKSGKRDRDDIAQKVRDWFTQQKSSFPEGFSQQAVPGLSFPLTLNVWKHHHPGDAGKVTLARSVPDTFEQVVEKALSDKLPKLAATAADERVLLLEQNVPTPDIVTIEDAVKKLSPNYPDYAKVDEIWVADTVAWNSEGVIIFNRAFADAEGRRERFKHRK